MRPSGSNFCDVRTTTPSESVSCQRQPTSAPRLGYFAHNGNEWLRVKGEDFAWHLVPAGGSSETSLLLTKPRNQLGSTGQLWDEQQLLVRMGEEDNATQRYTVYHIMGASGNALCMSGAADVSRFCVDLLHFDGTKMHPASPAVSNAVVRVTGEQHAPLHVSFSDKKTKSAFFRAPPAPPCRCSGQTSQLSRLWRQLQHMAAVGAIPPLTTGLVLLLVNITSLPVVTLPRAAESKELTSIPSLRLGLTFPGAVDGETGETQQVHQAVSPAFAVQGHVSSSKVANSTFVDCCPLLPAPAPQPSSAPPAAARRAIITRQAGGSALCKGTLLASAHFGAAAAAASARSRPRRVAPPKAQPLWVGNPHGAHIEAVVPAQTRVCPLCKHHACMDGEAPLVRARVGRQLHFFRLTMATDDGTVVMLSLRRGLHLDEADSSTPHISMVERVWVAPVSGCEGNLPQWAQSQRSLRHEYGAGQLGDIAPAPAAAAAAASEGDAVGQLGYLSDGCSASSHSSWRSGLRQTQGQLPMPTEGGRPQQRSPDSDPQDRPAAPHRRAAGTCGDPMEQTYGGGTGGAAQWEDDGAASYCSFASQPLFGPDELPVQLAHAAHVGGSKRPRSGSDHAAKTAACDKRPCRIAMPPATLGLRAESLLQPPPPVLG